MASRSRSQDWDPMREDFDNTNYEPQYRGGDNDNGGHVKLDHKRLYVRNIPAGLNQEGLRAAFARYGNLTEVFISSNPEKRYGLIAYETAGEARLAMTKLNKTEPLRLYVNIAHETKKKPQQKSERSRPNNSMYQERERERDTDDVTSIASHETNARRQEDQSYGENNVTMEDLPVGIDEDLNLECTDPELQLELTQLKIQKLKLQEAQIEIKEKMLLRQAADKKKMVSATRCVLPSGKVVLKSGADGGQESHNQDRETETNFIAGAGDSKNQDRMYQWDRLDSDDGSTRTSTCKYSYSSRAKKKHEKERKKNQSSKVRSNDRSESQDYIAYDEENQDYSSGDRSVYRRTEGKRCQSGRNRCYERNYCSCAERRETEQDYRYEATEKRRRQDHGDSTKYKSVTIQTNELASKDYRKHTDKGTEVNYKRDLDKKSSKHKSDDTGDLKFIDFYDSLDEEDETNKLIELRHSDYMDIIDDDLKIVVALPGYPKSKIRLRHLDSFQKCLEDVIDMQLKSGLVKKMPTFIDYYLNRGAIVCICKDAETRDWMLRIYPGLKERMSINLILLKSKVKRLCLAILKIPQSCWPATAHDAFKLLQYFNPTLKTELWKIYAQKVVDDIECTSFLIDRISGEIIRGPTFKNVIDYNQMEFELTGYTEIYYECLLPDLEDLSSVASRVKLLEEIKSQETTPRNLSSANMLRANIVLDPKSNDTETIDRKDENDGVKERKDRVDGVDVQLQLKCALQKDVLKKLKDFEYISGNNEIIIWCDEATFSNQAKKVDDTKRNDDDYFSEDRENVISTSEVAVSEKTESVYESNDTLNTGFSSLNIDSNKGIAYHRRTNYLDVENELKVAITLEGYPQNKLEGTHIRRLKHLFKEYLHKDMRNQRFANLIIPKFQDVYLSNGAVIYICDSLETKDYLTEILPKFTNSTGLKLTFRDIKDLVRYTRIVMRLPKEYAHVESVEILLKLQAEYPKLKPECWKYYSDVAGKQKRQFGVDPESLEVIKSPDFDPTYEAGKITFRIIDRHKRDISFEEQTTTRAEHESVEDPEVKKIREAILKNMYVTTDPEITKAPLAKIRMNHYSNLIPDDLKLYVGPTNYPESRIDDSLFHSIKRTFENVVREAIDRGEMNEETMPKFHDMYLFDGVIFIICQSMSSRYWIEQILTTINSKLHIHLKSTEFRGAVGIISMVVETDKGIDEVIEILQNKNPRLRTKYWRKISTVRTKTKLDVVLQIDMLSAQVMTSENFDKFIGPNSINFKLGHLKSMIKPKSSLEELTKKHAKKQNVSKPTSEKILGNSNSKNKVSMQGPEQKPFEEIKDELNVKYPSLGTDVSNVVNGCKNGKHKVSELEIDEESAIIIEKEDFKLQINDGKLNFCSGPVLDPSNEDPSIQMKTPRNFEDTTKENKQTPQNTDCTSEDSDRTLRNSSVKLSLQSSNETIKNTSSLPIESNNQTIHRGSNSSDQYSQTFSRSTSMLPDQSSENLKASSITPESNESANRNDTAVSYQSNLTHRGSLKAVPDGNPNLHKMILKIPENVLPDNKEDLSIIFDLLEDKNPGLNTELWQVYHDSPYPNNGRFTIMTDKQSAAIVHSKNFDNTIGGEKLRFYF